MNKLTLEQLSSFIDGEQTEDEQAMLEAVESDEEMRNAWSRYHLISDALRKSLPDQVSLDFSSRVSQAVAEEPTVLAPPRPRVHRALKPLAGLAIAASVAAVAIVGVQHLDHAVPGTPAPKVAQRQPAQPAPNAMSAQYAQTSAVQNQGAGMADTGMEGQRQGFSPRLSSYLVNHSEYNTGFGMQGMLPYVRIVGYESGN